MIPVHNLFEAHFTVADLDRAVTFYRDVLHLPLAHAVAARRAAFFWIGPAGNAMLGLWETGSGPQRMISHTALRTSLSDVVSAPALLRSAGLTPLDFDGRPTDQPVVLGWMPAASVFFHDPDGNLLEYIAMLPQAPRPELGVVPWREWAARHPTAS
jgi:lactoylglutathione lyase